MTITFSTPVVNMSHSPTKYSEPPLFIASQANHGASGTMFFETSAGSARMKKLILATSVALAAMTASAQAADLDRELRLIVSGVVDSWAGVQFIDDSLYPDETVFATGGEGLLSLPLGDNLSIQSDVKYETNDRAFEGATLPYGPRYSYQGAVHLSWRDPMSGLFGVFGGAGTSNQFMVGLTGNGNDFRFVGGEGQVYSGNMTFYVQGGYVDFVESSGIPSGNLPYFQTNLDEALFARGVFRWFPDNSSRLQLEGTYLNADFARGGSRRGMDAFSVKARYDFSIAGMPVVGDVPIFVAYRGTFRDSCVSEGPSVGYDLTDHTVMIGTSYSFSGDRLTVDRQGATLDTPDFNYHCYNDGLAEDF